MLNHKLPAVLTDTIAYLKSLVRNAGTLVTSPFSSTFNPFLLIPPADATAAFLGSSVSSSSTTLIGEGVSALLGDLIRGLEGPAVALEV